MRLWSVLVYGQLYSRVRVRGGLGEGVLGAPGDETMECVDTGAA